MTGGLVRDWCRPATPQTLVGLRSQTSLVSCPSSLWHESSTHFLTQRRRAPKEQQERPRGAMRLCMIDSEESCFEPRGQETRGECWCAEEEQNYSGASYGWQRFIGGRIELPAFLGLDSLA